MLKVQSKDLTDDEIRQLTPHRFGIDQHVGIVLNTDPHATRVTCYFTVAQVLAPCGPPCECKDPLTKKCKGGFKTASVDVPEYAWRFRSATGETWLATTAQSASERTVLVRTARDNGAVPIEAVVAASGNQVDWVHI